MMTCSFEAQACQGIVLRFKLVWLDLSQIVILLLTCMLGMCAGLGMTSGIVECCG